MSKEKYGKRFRLLSKRVTVIEDELKELLERVESIENHIKEANEERLNKLKAEIELAKFRSTLLK